MELYFMHMEIIVITVRGVRSGNKVVHYLVYQETHQQNDKNSLWFFSELVLELSIVWASFSLRMLH